MADQEYLKKLAALVRGSKRRNRAIEYTPAASSTDTALSDLHSLKRLRAFATRQLTDVEIVLELHNFERDTLADPVKGLDKIFAEYANDGRYHSEKMGLIKFIRKDGKVWWPDRYALRPTFGADDLTSEKAGKTRWEQIEHMRDKDPRTTLVLSWNLICEALGSGKLEGQEGVDPHARMYQASTDADGRMVLWVATIPQLANYQRPDRQRHIEIHPNQGGVLVQLTAPFLANLVYLLNDAGAADDGMDFAKSYYVSARRETVATLTKSIEEDEAELAKKRKRLSELTSSEPVSAE